MLKLKYTLDKSCLVENSDFDLSEFETLSVYVDTTGVLRIAVVNGDIVVSNKALGLSASEQVEENVFQYFRE